MAKDKLHTAIFSLPQPFTQFALLRGFWKSNFEELGLEPAHGPDEPPVYPDDISGTISSNVKAAYTPLRPRLRAKTTGEYRLSIEERQALAYYINVLLQEDAGEYAIMDSGGKGQKKSKGPERVRRAKVKNSLGPDLAVSPGAKRAAWLKAKLMSDGKQGVDWSLYNARYVFDEPLFKSGNKVWADIFKDDIWKAGMGDWFKNLAVQHHFTHEAAEVSVCTDIASAFRSTKVTSNQ